MFSLLYCGRVSRDGGSLQDLVRFRGQDTVQKAQESSDSVPVDTAIDSPAPASRACIHSCLGVVVQFYRDLHP